MTRCKASDANQLPYTGPGASQQEKSCKGASMPRQAKPRKWRKWYVSDVGGTRHKLCLISEGLPTAQAALNRLKVEKHDNGGRLPPELTVAEAAALFLRELETDKGAEHRTFGFYESKLQRLVERLGDRKLRSLTQQDGISFKSFLKGEARTKPTGRRKNQKRGKVRKPKPLGAVSVNHHLRAAKRLLNWCMNHEPPLLARSPFRSIKLEQEHGRERIMTNDEFQQLLAACTRDDQRDLLQAARLTAARPEDLRNLTWAMVKWDQRCWVLLKHKTATTQKERKPRIVPMVEAVEQLLRCRYERQGKPDSNGHVFLNEDGGPWAADDLSQWFRRLRERAGITERDGEQLVLYTSRHTRLTELAPDMNPYLLQQVAGHTTFGMTQRYLHVPREEVRDALEEADRRRRQSSDPAGLK